MQIKGPNPETPSFRKSPKQGTTDPMTGGMEHTPNCSCRRHAFLTLMIAAAASAAVFCWTVQFVFLLLAAGVFLRLIERDIDQAPLAFHAVAVVGAAVGASAIACMIAERRGGARRSLLAVLGAAIGAGSIVLMGLTGAPWLWPLQRTGLGGVVALVVLMTGLPNLGIWRIAVSRLYGVGDRAYCRMHAGILLAIWLIGGFIAYMGPHSLLLSTGAVLFALHSYPRLNSFPRVHLAKNAVLAIAAVVLLCVPARDLVLLTQGVSYGSYSSPNFTVLGYLPHLGLVGAFILSLGAAVAVTTLLADGEGEQVRHRSALAHGGLAMLVLAPTAFTDQLFHHLPQMLLLLLYTYYLFANGLALRPFFFWTVAVVAWVPFVGLAQYGWHYVMQWQSTSSLPTLWAHTIGCSDPFMWHDCLATSLCVTLIIAYGLWRTSKNSSERRFLGYIMPLFLATFVLAFARGAMVSLLSAVAVGAVLIGGRRRWWVPAIVIAAVVAFIIVQVTGAVPLERVFDREGSTAFRVRTAQTAWEVARQHPLFGVAPMEWDRLQTERGHSYGRRSILGWLQVPAQGGGVATMALLVLLATFGGKLRRVIADAPNSEDRLLVKCAVLAIIALVVGNFFDIVMLEEGVHMLPILLGAALGARSAWCST